MGFSFSDILFVLVSAAACLSLTVMSLLVYNSGCNIAYSKNKTPHSVSLLVLLPGCIVFVLSSLLLLALLATPLCVAVHQYFLTAHTVPATEVEEEEESAFSRTIDWARPSEASHDQLSKAPDWQGPTQTELTTLNPPTE